MFFYCSPKIIFWLRRWQQTQQVIFWRLRPAPRLSCTKSASSQALEVSARSPSKSNRWRVSSGKWKRGWRYSCLYKRPKTTNVPLLLGTYAKWKSFRSPSSKGTPVSVLSRRSRASRIGCCWPGIRSICGRTVCRSPRRCRGSLAICTSLSLWRARGKLENKLPTALHKGIAAVTRCWFKAWQRRLDVIDWSEVKIVSKNIFYTQLNFSH